MNYTLLTASKKTTVPATAQQIRNLCPGCGDAFIDAQRALGATTEEARTAFVAQRQQSAPNAAAPAPALAPPRKTNPLKEFNHRLEKLRAKNPGLSRFKAARIIQQEDPGLWQRVIVATNRSTNPGTVVEFLEDRS